MRRIAISLKRGYEIPQPRRENYQITCARSNVVSVGLARRNKNRRSRPCNLRSVVVPEMKLSLQNVPRFVIRVVDVEDRGSAAAPFVDTERPTDCGKGLRLHASNIIGIQLVASIDRVTFFHRNLDLSHI